MNRFSFWFIFIYLFGCAGSLLRHVESSSWPGIKPGPLALGAWSLSHWTTREVPVLFFVFVKKDDILVTQKHKWSTKRVWGIFRCIGYRRKSCLHHKAVEEMVFSGETQVSMKLEDGRNIHWRSWGCKEMRLYGRQWWVVVWWWGREVRDWTKEKKQRAVTWAQKNWWGWPWGSK